MKHLNRTSSLDRILLVSICATSIAMSACSEMSAKPEQLSEAQVCEDLKSLIADHPNQFSHYRKNLSTHRKLNIWSAKKVFPNADNCQVWEWSTGLYNYVCEWGTGSDENLAINNYQEDAKIIQNCLGEAWTAQTNTTHSGGKHTIYSTPDKPTIVSIRYFKDLRSWSKPWQNTISIGDKNNLKSPLQ
ncbi:MAG: hypothetical protein WC856_16765 [Methylococcaceae bacterium]